VQFDLVSWLIGIPSGIGVNWLSQWLFHKLSKKLKPKGDYFTATYSEGYIDFEGHVNAHISAEEVMQKFLEPTENEPNSRNQST
jgi:hypothetical protein